MDLLTTPLLVYVLGNLARELITDACKDHLKDKLKSLFGWLENLGERDKVETALPDSMAHAYSACLEMLLLNIKAAGYGDDELKEYRCSIEAFVKDAGATTIRRPTCCAKDGRPWATGISRTTRSGTSSQPRFAARQESR